MDSCNGISSYANADPMFYAGFIGYPTLTLMAQSGDYRNVPETNAFEVAEVLPDENGPDDDAGDNR